MIFKDNSRKRSRLHEYKPVKHFMRTAVRPSYGFGSSERFVFCVHICSLRAFFLRPLHVYRSLRTNSYNTYCMYRKRYLVFILIKFNYYKSYGDFNNFDTVSDLLTKNHPVYEIPRQMEITKPVKYSLLKCPLTIIGIANYYRFYTLIHYNNIK